MEALIEFVKYIFKLDWISSHPLGLVLVIGIVFAETGLLVGFFLPGDSLLFVTGMAFAGDMADPLIPFIPMMLLVSAAGVLGNMVGYWFGKKTGPMLYRRKDSFLFKKKHLLATKDFYERKGPGTIVLARFLPIVRTFAPIVAGIVNMNFRQFMVYNVVGSFAWVCSMMCIGYFLGNEFPILKERIELLIIGIILITTLPVLYKMIFGGKQNVVPVETPADMLDEENAEEETAEVNKEN